MHNGKIRMRSYELFVHNRHMAFEEGLHMDRPCFTEAGGLLDHEFLLLPHLFLSFSKLPCSVPQPFENFFAYLRSLD